MEALWEDASLTGPWGEGGRARRNRLDNTEPRGGAVNIGTREERPEAWD